MQQTKETRVRYLGWENPLEKEVVTYSSILAWKNPKDRGAWQAAVHVVAELDMTEHVSAALNEEIIEPSLFMKSTLTAK